MGSASKSSDFLNVKIEKLSSSNYSTWKFKTRMILIREDLWKETSKGVTGATAGDMLISQWKDERALATICLLIEDSQLIHIKSCKTAKECWDILETHYEKSSLVTRLFLRRKF